VILESTSIIILL